MKKKEPNPMNPSSDHSPVKGNASEEPRPKADGSQEPTGTGKPAEMPPRKDDPSELPSETRDVPAGKLFGELCRLSSFLRSEEGCPWDRAQTIDTLTPYLLEEACEAIEAVESGDMDRLREELGDLIFIVIFMADIAGSEGTFTSKEVLDGIRTKMLRRHPHIFGPQKDMTADQVKSQWETIKKSEGKKSSILKEYPISLPGLIQAYRIQEKAAAVGFDWEKTEQVVDKVLEELGEVKAALSLTDVSNGASQGQEPEGNRVPGSATDKRPSAEADAAKTDAAGTVPDDEVSAATGDAAGTGSPGGAPQPKSPSPDEKESSRELGDLLFAVVNLCRFTGADPERAIRGSVHKFRGRFRYIEEQLEKRGSSPAEATLEEMDDLWNEAKRRGI
jgi:XTP/dITP diphosphohydrolase/tetrapyrrole methylase family protein/MazG family protein